MPSGNGGRRTSVRRRRAAVKIMFYHACRYFAFPFVFIAFYTHGAGASPSSACGSPRAPGSLAELGAGLGYDRELVACFVRLDREPVVRADDRELVACLFVSIVNLAFGLGLCSRSAARGGFRPRCACCSSASKCVHLRGGALPARCTAGVIWSRLVGAFSAGAVERGRGSSISPTRVASGGARISQWARSRPPRIWFELNPGRLFRNGRSSICFLSIAYFVFQAQCMHQLCGF